MYAVDLRFRRGDVKQEEVRKGLGLNIGTLTDIERGSIGIDVETYERIIAMIDEIKSDLNQETQQEATV